MDQQDPGSYRVISFDQLRAASAWAVSALDKVRLTIAAAPKFVGVVVTEHKGIRRALVIWAAWLITHVTLRIFDGDLSKITANVVAALATIVGLLATVLAFYTAGRNKQDGESNNGTST